MPPLPTPPAPQATKHYQGKEGEEGGLTRAAVLRQEISKELSARYSEFK